MKLNQRQFNHAHRVALLILHGEQLGYDVRIASSYRKGDPKLHGYYLATDVDLFKDGVYLDKTEDHKELGEYWVSIGGTWGGDFDDGNHYSSGPYKGIR